MANITAYRILYRVAGLVAILCAAAIVLAVLHGVIVVVTYHLWLATAIGLLLLIGHTALAVYYHAVGRLTAIERGERSG